MIGTSQKQGKKRKVERVYVPEHWFDVIRSAREVKPFSVVPVTQEMGARLPGTFQCISEEDGHLQRGKDEDS